MHAALAGRCAQPGWVPRCLSDGRDAKEVEHRQGEIGTGEGFERTRLAAADFKSFSSVC